MMIYVRSLIFKFKNVREKEKVSWINFPEDAKARYYYDKRGLMVTIIMAHLSLAQSPCPRYVLSLCLHCADHLTTGTG